MRFSLFLALTLTLGACASDAALDDPVWKAGYESGCGMAHSNRAARASMTKDKPDLWKRGFSAGFTACGGNQETRQ